MACDHCGERPASIHLTQIVNNEVTTLHLCEQCAAEKGVPTNATVAKFPLSDFLGSMGKGMPGQPSVSATATGTCPSCGETLQGFRESGRLGCADCYQAFESHLRDLLRRLHGSSQHQGEQYRAAGRLDTPPDQEIDDLRAQLQRAIEAENFELAARLRDQIKVLE